MTVQAEVTDHNELRFAGRSVPIQSSFWPPGSADRSLWTCRLFPVLDTMEASFEATLDLVRGLKGVIDFGGERKSMDDLIRQFDGEVMLRWKEALLEKKTV